MEVLSVKLISGEEIIARVTGAESEPGEGTVYQFEKIRTVFMIPQQGRMMIELVPWMAADPDAKVKISSKNMLSEPLKPIDQLEKRYLEGTTGIELAK